MWIFIGAVWSWGKPNLSKMLAWKFSSLMVLLTASLLFDARTLNWSGWEPIEILKVKAINPANLSSSSIRVLCGSSSRDIANVSSVRRGNKAELRR